MSSLEVAEAAAAAVQKTPNRVTLDQLWAKVETEAWYQPPFAPHVMVCVMKLKNGFVLVGKSAPADAANFNAELGMDLAREDCIRQLWPLAGYALRERLAEGG